MDLITLMKKNFPDIPITYLDRTLKTAILNVETLVDQRRTSEWSSHKPQLPGTSLVLKRPDQVGKVGCIGAPTEFYLAITLQT